MGGMSIKIYLLGQFKLHANDLPIELPSRPAQSLLAYLALNPGVTQRREKLASLLWPEATEANARSYLRQALWRVHKSLEGGSLDWEDYLQVNDIDVTFDAQSDYWLDAECLLAKAEQQSVEDMIQTVNLYRGELLSGFYDEWIVLERERLQIAYHQKMNLLLECLIQESSWDEALGWSEQWIRLGYSPEPAFRASMIAYAGLGDQSMVSATYQRCVESLNRDLGLDPSPETNRLYQQLIYGESLPLILGLPEIEKIYIQEELPAPGPSPYKGLEYFDVEDAGLFYGRENLTARLASRLREGERLLFVVGASGSGKSSLVRAGLISALKQGHPLTDGSYPPEGSTDWLVHIIQPSDQPIETLATSLCHGEPSLRSVATLIDDLRQDPRSLNLCAKRLCQSHDATRLLLVVDQFEEVFTLCQDQDQRVAFIDNLLTATKPDGSGPTILVITLRADFYTQCAQYPELRQQLALHQEYIGPMSTEELRKAIEEPAVNNGWGFEVGLVDLILRDIKGQPGSLPLLSHALLETWQRRRGHILTLQGYAESGSVQGAIAHTAEAVYQRQLDDSQKAIARQIFLRLTELGENTPETRRRTHISELLSSVQQRADVEAVLEKLVEARLVTVNDDYLEVSHEALIREWPTLRVWLEEDLQGLKLHRQLTEAALAWESMERDESILYRGTRLAQALEWAQENNPELNILEREFLEASKELAERRRQEREEQRQRELRAAHQLADSEQQRAQEQTRANRRLRWLVAGLAGFLLVAILSAFFAIDQRRLAQNEAHLATSRELAAAAVNNLDDDPELGILLALESVGQAKRAGLAVPREAEEALHQSLQASRLEMVLLVHPDGVKSIDYSPDGTRLVSVGKDRSLKVWDAHSGELLDSALASFAEISQVAFSTDGEYLATADHDLSAKIWDSHSLTELSSLSGHTAGVINLAFSPDGARLVTSSLSPWDGQMVWDISTGKLIATLVGHEGIVVKTGFSPDGKWIATACVDGTVRLWDATTYEEVHILGEGESIMIGLAFSPDSSLLAASNDEGMVMIWDVTSGEHLLTIPAHADWIMDIEFSPDGSRLATTSLDRKARIWEVSTGRELLELSGHTDIITSVAFHPDGQRLATASKDGTIRIWNVALSREWLSFPAVGGAGRIAFSPDSDLLAAGSGFLGGLHLWDLTSGVEPLKLSQESHPGGVEAVAFSPDGEQLASTGMDNRLNIWLTYTGQLLRTKEVTEYNIIHAVAFNPDGSIIAVGGEGYSIKLLDAATAERLAEFSDPSDIHALAFSPDGSLLASTSTLGYASLWDLRTAEKLQTIGEHSGALGDIAFDPFGVNLALASDDGTVSVWQIVDGTLKLTLSGHSAPVLGVAYSPDGDRIATASLDGTARLWDATTGEELLRINAGGGAGLVDVAYSPDGKMLATSGIDAVRVYLLEIDDLTALAESRLSRGYKRQECLRFLSEERCDSLVYPDITPLPAEKIDATGSICQFVDETGLAIDNFNYPIFQGVLISAELFGWEKLIFIPETYESDNQEFERTLDAGCDLIITSGFPFADLVESTAIKHPGQRFLLLDYVYDPPLENVRSVSYATDQGSFLAGYLAAAMTQTDVIGTFGGANIPPVTDFMTGFESGMAYYNRQFGDNVKLLGWNTAEGDGYFTGDFCCHQEGYDLATELLDEGADIIFPVAGDYLGLGATQAVMERGNAYVIGVDFDYAGTFPQYAEVVLTSVEKRFDVSILVTADALANGEFKGGTHLGTLETGEVGLAPFHELEAIIPEHIKSDLEQIKAEIIADVIQTKPGE